MADRLRRHERDHRRSRRFTIVGTRPFAIMTTFGRPTEVSLNIGWSGTWPRQMSYPMDGARQTDQYVTGGNNEHRIAVHPLRANLIERKLSQALHEVFAVFNPLDPPNPPFRCRDGSGED